MLRSAVEFGREAYAPVRASVPSRIIGSGKPPESIPRPPMRLRPDLLVPLFPHAAFHWVAIAASAGGLGAINPILMPAHWDSIQSAAS
jgi:hypothetical protein